MRTGRQPEGTQATRSMTYSSPANRSTSSSPTARMSWMRAIIVPYILPDSARKRSWDMSRRMSARLCLAHRGSALQPSRRLVNPPFALFSGVMLVLPLVVNLEVLPHALLDGMRDARTPCIDNP